MTMYLKISVPERIVLATEAEKITAEGLDGSFCLLPNHIDYATALDVGIVSFVDPAGTEQFVAVDRGLLIKRGDDVEIAVRRAVHHASLEELARTVQTTYRKRTEEERDARRASAQLEAGFVRRFLELGEPQL